MCTANHLKILYSTRDNLVDAYLVDADTSEVIAESKFCNNKKNALENLKKVLSEDKDIPQWVQTLVNAS